MENTTNYAEAFDVILSNEEKLKLMHKINQTLLVEHRWPERGVATNPEQFIEALKSATYQLNRILFSSGFNPWVAGSNLKHVNEKIKALNDVASFDDFVALHEKLTIWSHDYEEAIYNDLDNNRTLVI